MQRRLYRRAACLTHGPKDRAAVDKYGREALEKTYPDAISASMIYLNNYKKAPDAVLFYSLLFIFFDCSRYALGDKPVYFLNAFEKQLLFAK